MSIRSVLTSRWLTIPLGIIILVLVGLAGYLTIRLATSTPGMYTDRMGRPAVRPTSGADPVISSSASPASEIIVYTSLRPSNWDIFLFEGSDPGPVRLTDHPDLDYNPVFSPDGRWIVFVSERTGNPDLYALRLGSNSDPVRLTANPAMDDAPAFSPDGTRLAFVSTREGNPDVFIMPFAPDDSTAESRSVNLTDNPYGDFNPAFSPDGTRIAFSSNRAIFGRWNPFRLFPLATYLTSVYVMNDDGTDVTRAAAALGTAGSPAWTEDGTAILYHVGSEESSTIHRVTLESGDSRPVSPDSLFALTPASDPHGNILFVAVDRQETPPAYTDRPYKDIHGGRIFWYDPVDSTVTPISDPNREFLAPDYHSATGRIVVHGDGPVEDLPLMANRTPFTWPASHQNVHFADRVVDVRMLRAYFPARSPVSDRVFAVQWVHEYNGWPRGPSPIVSATPSGSGLETVYTPSDGRIVWTPVVARNGDWVFFSSGTPFSAVDEDVDIWKVRPDGSGAENLTPGSDANDAFPDVSADGSRIVFRSGRDAEPGSGRDGNKEIYLMNADGMDVRRITYEEGNDTMPAISPDGMTVVFSTDRTGNGMKLWIQSLDDPDDPGRLVEPNRVEFEGLDMHPRFSPDGRWIVFVSDRAGFGDEWMLSALFPQPYGELFAVPVDGSGPAVRLTHNKWEDALPHWSSVHPAGAD